MENGNESEKKYHKATISKNNNNDNNSRDAKNINADPKHQPLYCGNEHSVYPVDFCEQ